MIDYHTGKKQKLASLNGDYDNQDNLYICTLRVMDYEGAYSSASRIVVQMYDVLTCEKYQELQSNVCLNKARIMPTDGFVK